MTNWVENKKNFLLFVNYSYLADQSIWMGDKHIILYFLNYLLFLEAWKYFFRHFTQAMKFMKFIQILQEVVRDQLGDVSKQQPQE